MARVTSKQQYRFELFSYLRSSSSPFLCENHAIRFRYELDNFGRKYQLIQSRKLCIRALSLMTSFWLSPLRARNAWFFRLVSELTHIWTPLKIIPVVMQLGPIKTVVWSPQLEQSWINVSRFSMTDVAWIHAIISIYVFCIRSDLSSETLAKTFKGAKRNEKGKTKETFCMRSVS